ncbi:tail length tape-measure protein 1 [Pseudoalteromonas phage Pq0]|uniref:tail length tape measure protein n=1 Tax=Pseudoalteromonas phage Pq0 TaxID=1667322 RepID=UPI000655EE98|nr:tail length tape measure protein [Pseudoalteromonas phage Pq0]AKN44288.1 tail length tape-measure protein 1 [Pseudoalteromonas phage Pq0]
MTMIGSISAKITADDSEFLAAMERTKRSLRSQSARLRSSANDYAKWGAAAAAAATAVGSAIVKSTADSIRQLQTFSQVSNTSAQDFQRLAYAASTVSVEEEKLADILKDVNDRIGDFKATGGGAMADFFNNIAPKVGVTYENFRKLSGKDALQLYVSSLEKANLSQADMTFYMEAIASDATLLIPLLRDGGKAFNTMAAEADSLGLVLSDIDIAKAAAAAEQMGKLQFLMNSAAQQATVELAPAIIGISQALIDAAKDAGGFGNVFFNVMDISASVIGVFADGIRGVRLIVAALEVALWSLGGVTSSAMQSAARGIDAFIEGTKENLNSLIATANKLPGVSIELFKDTGSNIASFFEERNNEVQRYIGAAIDKLQKLALKELPSKSIKNWLAEVRASADEAAQAVAAATAGNTSDDTGGGTSKGLNEDQKRALKEKAEAIRRSNLSEVEALKEKFALEAEVLAMAREQDQISKQMFNDQMLRIAQNYSENETKIIENAKKRQMQLEEMAMKAKLSTAKTLFGNLSTLMNTESRKMFEIGKTAAIANAVISAYEGISLTMSKYPYPLNIGMAAAHGVAAFAQVQQIKSQSFSKGAGSGQVFSGGTPATPTTEATGQQQTSRNVQISLTGSSFGAAGIRDLISEINQAVGDGVSLTTG